MIYRAAFLCCIVIAFVLGLGSEKALGFSLAGIDKPVHFAGFFGLAALGALGWPRERGLFLLALPLLGLGIEAAQTFAPGRGFDWSDALVNAIGVGLGVGVTAWITSLTYPRPR